MRRLSKYEKNEEISFSAPRENAVLQKILTTENKWKEIFQPSVSHSVRENDNKLRNTGENIYISDISDLFPSFSSLSRPNTETKTYANTTEEKYKNQLFQPQTKTDQEFQKKLQFDTMFLEKALSGAIRQNVQKAPFQKNTRESNHTEWNTTRQLQTNSQKYHSISSFQKENTPIFMNGFGYQNTKNLSPVRLPVQTDLSVKLQNQSAVSDGNIKVTVSEVENKIEKEIQKQDVRGKVLTSFEIEPKQELSSQIENIITELPELNKIDKTVDIAINGNPQIQNSEDISSYDFGIPKSKNESVTLFLDGNKEIVNQLNVMAEEFGIAPSVMQTIAVQLLGQTLPKQTEKPQAASFGIPSEIAQTIGINLTGQKNILNSVSVSASDFGVPSSIYQSVAVHLTPYVTTGSASLGSLRKARGGIVGKNGAIGFADGGMVRGGPQLITVAEEGTPEMIIPLGSQRRQRAVQLWKKTGHILGAPGFANGGLVSPSGQTEETLISHTANVSNPQKSFIYAPAITDNAYSITAKIKELFENIAKVFESNTSDFFTTKNQSVHETNISDSFSAAQGKFKTLSKTIEISSEYKNEKSKDHFNASLDIEKYFYSQLIDKKNNEFYSYQQLEKTLCSNSAAFEKYMESKYIEEEKTFRSDTGKQFLSSFAGKFVSSEYQKQDENNNTIFSPSVQKSPLNSFETISKNEKNISRITPNIERYQTNSPLSITIGNIAFQIEMKGENNDLLSSIEDQKEKIADCIAKVISQALQEKFENTPLRGGQTA